MCNSYEEKLLRFIAEHEIQAEHLSLEQSCRSVAEAARAVNAAADEFVKNICMIDAEGELIVAIVKGEDRVSRKRVGRVLGIVPPRLATAEEILERTGYPCGGTPSFGFQATFLIDPKVFERAVVYTGGGSETSLVKIGPEEMQRANKGTVKRVRK
ncbi:MAG: YbaK/EbsC family protein [Anaerolineae bacterium]